MLLAATVLCSSAALAQDAAPARRYAPASVSLFNREIVEFRAPLLGASPADRAASARERIRGLLDRGGPAEVTVQAIPQGAAVQIDGQLAFVVADDDASALYGPTFASVLCDPPSSGFIATGSAVTVRRGVRL